MTPRLPLRPVLRLGTLAGLVAATRFATTTPVPVPTLAAATAEPNLSRPALSRLSPDSLARSIAGRDPFRVTRRPAAVGFDPDRGSASVVAPVVPAPPRPTLVLVGVLLGPDPVALVDGLPGSDRTRVLREGERVGAYQVRRIAATEAVIAGPDTTWTLRLRSAFP